MGQTTKIEWCDTTWNPIRGCSRVSEGCRNCYAERMAMRFRAGPGKGAKRHGEFHRFASPNGWTGKVEVIEHKLLEPLRWRKPRRVFVNSMSDLFHESLPDESIDRVFAVMALCPQHTFQVLTKRAERMAEYLLDAKQHPEDIRDRIDMAAGEHGACHANLHEDRWPLPNVHLGVSAENQPTADERIPWLLKTPAARRFVSYEPALGPVDFKKFLEQECPYANEDAAQSWYENHARLDQIIVGGESGPGARPMAPDWARSIRDQCQAAGVAFFFKQWGAFSPTIRNGDGVNVPLGNGTHHRMFRVGKKAAGRLLDGREWNEEPSR